MSTTHSTPTPTPETVETTTVAPLNAAEHRLLDAYRKQDWNNLWEVVGRANKSQPVTPPKPRKEPQWVAPRPATSTKITGEDGYRLEGAANLRRAFAVVGGLIGWGVLDVDLNNGSRASWADDFDYWVSIVATTLDALMDS